MRGLLGLDRLRDGLKLHKGKVSLHIDAHELSVGLEEVLEVGLGGGGLVEVDDKERVRGLGGLAAAFVLLALDAAIAAGKLGADGL